jgi:site-specific recombinase XerD
MLEKLFTDGKAAQRHRCSLLGAYLDSFAAAVAGLGYVRTTARTQVWVLQDLGRWLERQRMGVVELDEQVLERFLVARRRRGRLHRSDAATLRRFLDHLRKYHVVPAAEIHLDDSFIARLERRFETYLKHERGLAQPTLVAYRPFIDRFLVERFGAGRVCLQILEPSDISDFVRHHAPTMTRKRAQLMVTALRSFFRFLLQYGEIETDLAASVPTVANWRLTSVPRHLSEEMVNAVLRSCDRNTVVGRRDYVILLLLARLGLRAGEVVNLELDDIDWRASEIVVRGKGSVHDRLPLVQEVGEALAAYLRRDRPLLTESRRVFLQVRAPRCGFRGPATVSTIVARALQRAGLDPPEKGAHLLRHTLATGMLRRGATMAEIAEVLRHRSPRTTEIYAKVDVTGLRTLAQPWPGCGGVR